MNVMVTVSDQTAKVHVDADTVHIMTSYSARIDAEILLSDSPQ